MDILVSVNCITYNHEKYIADAIESFLMQKVNFKYEIVIGEDCSSDRTLSIIETYHRRYPELIKIITSQHNVGMHKNSQRILEASVGKYIAICEGDDYWTDCTKLQKQVDYLEENPECTLCFHTGVIVDYDKNETGQIFIPKRGFSSKFYYKKNYRYSAGEILLLNDFPTNSMIFPRHILNDTPQWWFEAPAGDICLKFIAAYAGYAYYMDEIMCAYRYNVPTSVSNSWKRENNDEIIKRLQKFLVLFECFHKYSCGKFKMELSALKMLHVIRILELKNQRKKIFHNNNFPAYNHYLSFWEKIILRIRIYFPDVYSGMKKKYLAVFTKR